MKITIYGVEYQNPDENLWENEDINDIPLTEEQYNTFLKGYAPDWECRYAPFFYNDWLYITRSGFWVKKFQYRKSLDGLYHISEHYTTDKEIGRNLLLEILIEGYFEPTLRDVALKLINPAHATKQSR